MEHMDFFSISKEDLGKDAKIPLVKLGTAGEVFYEMAMDMITTIKAHNAQNRQTVFICPVGPVGQYPIFVRLVNEQNISLKNVWFFSMDEYLTDDKQWIDSNHRLSFRGFMLKNVYAKIKPELLMNEAQRVFPAPQDCQAVPNLIEKLGGVDVCYGGVGINGHLAFNEPEDVSVDVFKTRQTRVLEISPETRTINSVGDLNGAIAAMPKWCVTIGIKEIFAAKKVRLYCFRDWHRSVVRQAVYGEKSALFPVTLMQDHPDARLTITENAAEKPW